MLCESTWVKNKTESLPESQYIITSLEMLWFWWICCMMQKLKSKSNSVNIHTGHPVFWQEFTVLMIFCKMGCQFGSFFEWNKASLLVTWLVKTPLASICSEHFKLPCSQAIQLHEVWLLSQEVCDVWVLRKVECHGMEECEEEEANSFKISWVLKSLYAGVRCGRCGVQPPRLFMQLLQQQ